MTKHAKHASHGSVKFELPEAQRNWFSSAEARQTIVESLERAQELTREFREAQRVNPDSLHKPVTR